MHIQKTKPYTLLINLSSAEERVADGKQTRQKQKANNRRRNERERERDKKKNTYTTQEGQHDTLKQHEQQRKNTDSITKA